MPVIGKPRVIVSLDSEKCSPPQGPGIGSASLSAFGFVGAALEIILILYPFFSWPSCLLTSFLSRFLGQWQFTKTLAEKKKQVILPQALQVAFGFVLNFLWARRLREAAGDLMKRAFLGVLSLDSHSYLMVSSVVGFYSLRFFGDFIPRKDDTTMTKVRDVSGTFASPSPPRQTPGSFIQSSP